MTRVLPTAINKYTSNLKGMLIKDKTTNVLFGHISKVNCI